MLEVLQSRRKDVDARIRAIESLVEDKLDAVATAECRSLLAAYGGKPLSDAQRAAILTLQAELAVRANQPAEARTILSNLPALYPKEADPVKIKLVLGQAKLRSGGEATAEGLVLLKELAGQGDTPAAATAQWELINFDLSQGTDAARTAALAKWLADHPKHFRADEARRQLLTAYLTLAAQAVPPRPDSPLSDADLAALGVADEIIKHSPRSEEQAATVQRVSQHLAAHYTERQAYSATVAGLRKLLASPLPRLRGLGSNSTSSSNSRPSRSDIWKRNRGRAALQRRSRRSAQGIDGGARGAGCDPARQSGLCAPRPPLPNWRPRSSTSAPCRPGPIGSPRCRRRMPGQWPLSCRSSRPTPTL